MTTGQQEQQRRTVSDEQIRDEVRRTLAKLTELANTEKDFDQFCREVLLDVVKITGAYCSVLWQFDGNSPPRIAHRAGDFPHASAAGVVSPDNSMHANALMEVIGQQLPVGLASDAFTGEPNVDDQGKEPPPFLLLLSPILDRNKVARGAIELVQRGEVGPQAQEGYLRFLTQIAKLFFRWSEKQNLVQLTESVGSWENRLEYINETHRSIDSEETAYSIANEARRLLKCDRVSVGLWNGRRCNVRAISSQDRFDNRSNVIRLLSNVATAAVKADTRFWVVGDTQGLAPEVAKKINEYLDESHSRTLVVIPLVAKLPELPDLEMRSKKRPRPTKLGAIALEYFDADVPESQIEDDCKLVVQQAEIALENARRHGEIFMQPVWKRLGWLQKLLFRDHLAKTLTGLTALTLLTLGLIFIPWELKMKAEGVMHPTLRRTIFSEAEGLISVVSVDEQQNVTAGQPLLQIEDPNLETQIDAVHLELESLSYQIEGFATRAHMPDIVAGDRDELRISIKTALQKQATLRRQLEILNKKKDSQTVVSPIDGTVITHQPKRRLTGLPATRDFALLEVADLDGDWQLELKIPEGRVGYVDKALEAADGQPLHVDFKIGSNPILNLVGSLTQVARRAVPSEQGVTEFRAIVQIGPDQLEKLQDELKSGVGVTARIHCGQRASGFVCLYQVFDYLRTNVFF